LLIVAGICHFGILTAGALAPGVLDWRGELKKLNPLSRQLIWAHGAFIVLTIIAFGTLTIGNAGRLAGGDLMGRWLCGFIALFWLARLGLQFFYFDARPMLKNVWLAIGYNGLTVVFAYFVAVYGWVAVRA
jgi:hypothetical protein